MNGKSIRYNSNGSIDNKADYKDDKLNGYYIQYNSDGSIRYEREYKDGIYIKTWYY